MTANLRFRVTRPAPSPPAGTGPLRFGAASSGPTPPPPPPPPALPPVPVPPAGNMVCSLVSIPWQAARPCPAPPVRMGWGASAGQAMTATTRMPWGAALQVAVSTAMPWAATAGLQLSTRLPWGYTELVATGTRLPWQAAASAGRGLRLPWGAAAPVVALPRLRWGGSASLAHGLRLPWGAGSSFNRLLAWRHGRAAARSAGYRLPWGPAQGLFSLGVLPDAPFIPPAPAPHDCRLPREPGLGPLRFNELRRLGAALLFRCVHGGGGVVIVPVQEVYAVSNSASLVRVSDGTDIPCDRMSISIDHKSWTWGFSASIPGWAVPLVQPAGPGQPIELEATINGVAVRVVVEGITRERSWPTSEAQINGRGISSVLDAPTAIVQSYGNPSATRTSQQLVDDALPSGWACDWQLTPWVVPAGAWSIIGTPINAVLDVVQAAGGYVLPDATAKTLHALPIYPVDPLDWDTVTPDYVLPSAVMERESIQWLERPIYDVVYVSGTNNAGVLGKALRRSAAGVLPAPMVTHALITHADAVRQRALPILGDVGRQAHVGLRLPVLPATGVVLPGKFVSYVDGAETRLGITRGVSVDVGVEDDTLVITQLLTVETHE